MQLAAKVRNRICATSSACLKAALAGALCICSTGLALAKDDDDDDGSSNGASKTPNIYLDMRTAYASVPAGSLPIGFGSPALVTALQSLALSRANSLPASPGSLTLPAAQAVVVDLPLTVDVTDGVSLYAGLSGIPPSPPLPGWSRGRATSGNSVFRPKFNKKKGAQIQPL